MGEKQPLIWLLANIGGTAGLTTGASLVSLCEVLYFFANWVYHVRKQSKVEAKRFVARRRLKEAIKEHRLTNAYKDIMGYSKDEARNREEYRERMAKFLGQARRGDAVRRRTQSTSL